MLVVGCQKMVMLVVRRAVYQAVVGWVGISGGAANYVLPAVFVSSGKPTPSFDSNGNLTSATLNGSVKADIYAALS